MSQAKVDRYKEQKKNRKEIMAKQKREWMMTKAGLSAVALVLVGWIGFSVYNGLNAPAPEDTTVKAYTIDTSALDEYVDGLDSVQ